METKDIKNIPHVFRVIISEGFNDSDIKDFWSETKAIDFFNDQSIIKGVSLTLTELQPSTNGSWVFFRTLKRYTNPNY